MPEAFLLLLVFAALLLFLVSRVSEVVSASFKKGLLFNTFFPSELAGGLGALGFFIDDFLFSDFVAAGLHSVSFH